MDWMKRMHRRASELPDIKWRIDEVMKWEDAYLAIRDSLPEADRNVLEAYLSACEELDHGMLLLAYEEGWERGRMDAK